MIGWRQALPIDRKLARLEQLQRQRAGSAQNWNGYQFTMSPTCPPSTSIALRGGSVWSASDGDFIAVPSGTFNLADRATTGREAKFTIVNGYAFYWLAVALDGSRLYTAPHFGATWWWEYSTSAEAEAAATATNCTALHNYTAWDIGIPIGCVIVRNNGDIVGVNQFLPVDKVNRGRSYILMTHQSVVPRNID